MEPNRERLQWIVGQGIYTGLRKYCSSPESHHAWREIYQMPDKEWDNLISIVVGELIKELKR